MLQTDAWPVNVADNPPTVSVNGAVVPDELVSKVKMESAVANDAPKTVSAM